MRIRHLAAAACLAAALAGCGGLAPADFADGKPTFDPAAFFAGPVHSWGVIEDRAGEPTHRFTTASTGREEGGELVIDQHIAFDDGRRQDRIWHLRRLDEHRYEATVTDIVGTATGEAHGNALVLDYTLTLSPGNPLTRVHMRHWMYLQEDGSMVNRVIVSKLGVTIAEVTEHFRRGS